MIVKCTRINDIVWEKPSSLNLENRVAVFRINLAENLTYSGFLPALLHSQELLRAKRYHKEADQQRFILTRAALRILLGKYTGQAAEDIIFSIGKNKKPIISNSPDLHYNVAHSRGWALIALSRTEVGVDIEQIDPLFSFQEIIQHSFNAQESDFIQNSASSSYFFYQSWTRKEALVKATAQGITADFHTIPSLDGSYYLENRLDSEVTEWMVSSFEVAPDYSAAVAHTAASIQFYDFNLFSARINTSIN